MCYQHNSLSTLRGVCVFTKMAMVQRNLVAGNAGRADVQGLAVTFHMMSFQATVQCLLIPLKSIIKLSKGLSQITTTSLDTLNSLQIFPPSESV